MSYAVAVSKFAKTKGGKVTIQVVVGALVVLVVYLVLKKVFKEIGEGFGNWMDSRTIRQVIAQTPPSDGTTPQNSFKPQAKQIADQCEQAMVFSWGGNWTTDEKTLFSSIIDLNGAQLQQVYEEFSLRDGADLFQWYREDLGNGLVLISQATQWGMTEGQIETHMGANPVNNSSITERQLMANIWEKSGLITGL